MDTGHAPRLIKYIEIKKVVKKNNIIKMSNVKKVVDLFGYIFRLRKQLEFFDFIVNIYTLIQHIST